MFDKAQRAMLKDAIELKRAQIARFAKTQPAFAPIAEKQDSDYASILLKLSVESEDEKASGVQKK